MKPISPPNPLRTGYRRLAKAGLLASLAFASLASTAAYADMYHQAAIPGGVTASSTITSMTQQGTNVLLTWYGPQGSYFIEMTSTNVPASWTVVGSTTASDYAWSFVVTNVQGAQNFFRVRNYNGFVGSGACGGCHGDKYAEEIQTGHATAFNDIANLPWSVRQTCIVCHTVGYGQPTGFVTNTTTAYLLNVGCENCHGPGGAHKYGDHSIVHPMVTIDPAICGGCHDGDHHPTYTEYETTLHAQVNDDVKYGFNSGVYFPGTVVVGTNTLYGYYITTNANGTLKTNATTGIISSSHVPGSSIDPGNDRQVGCGMCHSGATRMAMLYDYEARQAGRTNALALPTANDSGAYGPTCAVCHDPHADYNVAQLRNPTRSTNYFTMATTSDKRTVYTTNIMGAVSSSIAYYNTTFASLYDENIQVCGQCHNTRGARWDGRSYGLITNGTSVSVGLTASVSFSRPPHNSVQYNVLVGIVQPDYLTTDASGVATNYVARHGIGVSTRNGSYNTNQCATCHVPNYNYSVIANGTTNTFYVTGHTFNMDTNGCALGGCHLNGVPDIEGFQTTVTNNISAAVALLNQWATNKGPALFTTNYPKYLQNSWEFTTIGLLASITNAGPSSADQLKIPNNIKQARFNLYMARNDGSLGVHNPNYVPFLIADANDKVMKELYSQADFKASATLGVVPFTVNFTNIGPSVGSVTNFAWTFGDGGTASGANPTYTYTTPGVYTVSLTANGETLTFNNYITATNAPVANFTAGPATTGTHPLTVYFTNLSQYATAYSWTFGDGKTSTSTSPANTYTNAGTYTVTLRARNLGVTNTLTQAGYIIVQ